MAPRTFFLVISRVTILPGYYLEQVLKYYTAKLLYKMLEKHCNFGVLYRLGFLKKLKMFKENANIGVLLQ